MATAKTARAREKQAPARRSAREESGPELASPSSLPERRVTLHGICWQTYESLLKDLENSSTPRLTYDRGTLEIMSPLQEHEELRRNLEALLEIVAEMRDLDVRGLGSTTFRREDLERGFEPDACFYIQNAERIRGKTQVDLSVDPPPDLVIEIDLTRSSLDKLPIYAQLGVPEVWRYTDRRLVILILRDGTYQEQNESVALSGVESASVAALVEEAPVLRRPAWLQKVREWAGRQSDPADAPR
jgi:Uma2 family endonuclease